MTNTPQDTRRKGLSRRQLLAGAAAVTTAGLPLLSLPDSAATGGMETEAAILSILRHRDSAEALGKAALSSWPEFRDRKALLANIVSDLRLDNASIARSDAPDIAGRLVARMRDDFANARTFMLDGWVLSAAETRLYALAALAEQG